MNTPSPPASPGPEAYNDEEHSGEGEYNYGHGEESDLRSPPASPVPDNENEQEPEESDVFRSPPASPGLEIEDNDEPRETSGNDGAEKNETGEEGPRSPPSSPNYRSDDDDEDKDEPNDTAEHGQDDDEEDQPGEVGKLISNIFGDESDGEGEQEQQNEGYDGHIRAELQESEEEEKEWDFDTIIEAKKKERGKKRRRRRDGSIDLCSNADGQIRHVVELMKDAAAADREANNQRRPAVQKTKMLEVVRSVLLRADFFEALLENDMMSAISEWLAPLPDKSLPALEIRSTLLKILEGFPSLEPGVLKQSGLGKAVMLIFKHPKETRENKIIASKLIRNWSQPIFQISSDYSSMSRDERERLDLDHLPEAKRRKVEDRLSQGSSSQKITKPEERLLGPGDKGFINRARVPQKSTAAYIIRPKPKVEYNGPFRGSSKSSSNSRFDKAAREFKERTKSSKSQRAVGVSIEGRKMEI